jgi:hypothetical protein
MAWPTKLRFVDLYASIQGLNSAYLRFLPILTSLLSKLTVWLDAVQYDPTSFTSPSIPFLEVHDLGFPDIKMKLEWLQKLLLIVAPSCHFKKWLMVSSGA